MVGAFVVTFAVGALVGESVAFTKHFFCLLFHTQPSGLPFFPQSFLFLCRPHFGSGASVASSASYKSTSQPLLLTHGSLNNLHLLPIFDVASRYM